ncbi:MAG TPA: response regulator [Xenococcaceae cyanobacterium]|jgi:CheY-like chemotaxis protein
MNSPNSLFDLLIDTEKNNFTGKGLIKSSKDIQWQLYFLLGKLIWINGGDHPNRSWLRHLIEFCAEVNFKELFVDTKNHYQCSQYQTLYCLFSKQLISKDCVKAIIEKRLQENFFDILQNQHQHPLEYLLQPENSSNLLSAGFKPSLVIIDDREILTTVQQYSLFFTKSRLKNISLNHAPKLLNTQELKQKLDLNTYNYLVDLFKGKLSLRDLSFKLNKDALQFALSLVPDLLQKRIQFVEIPDVASNLTAKQYNSQFLRITKSAKKFTIACIDNSDHTQQIMHKIVTQANGKFVAIKDEFQVIPDLVAHTPDVIFINLNMPVVNGFELCSQIRRVTKFTQTPIIMMSENNSLTERMRAKLVGTADYITKPIDEQRVTKTIKKLITNSEVAQSDGSGILAIS